MLALLAVSAAATGAPAALLPERFYEDFPFVASWVDRLPPYSEHFVRDTGAFYLAFAVLFAFAAVRPQRALVVPVCVAWCIAALLHLAFHVTHLGGFPAADALAQTAGLAALVVMPLAVLVLCPRDAEEEDAAGQP